MSRLSIEAYKETLRQYIAYDTEHEPSADIHQEGEETISPEVLFPVINWKALQDINPDVVGWITIPSTSIDYPILQASQEDPEYYLSHDMYGIPSTHGSIFLDAECAQYGGLDAPHVVLYGHHMLDGSMFAEIAHYREEEFFTDHQMILIQTPTSRYTLRAGAVRVVPGWEPRKQVGFASNDELQAYIKQEVLNAKRYNLSNSLDENPTQLVTLVTCSYTRWIEDERTLLYAW